jgi:hypothetical protein
MAPVKRRRRLPTLVNRGLGLLEVILPGRGPDEGSAILLPPGKRDASGFWFPAQCERPGDIFTEQQRRLQAKQRAVQKRRRRVRAETPGPPRGAAPRAAAASPPGPAASAERSVPLPLPRAEAGGSLPGAPRTLSSSVTHPLLSSPLGPPPPRAAAARVPLVVDSGKGSE